MNTSKRFVHIIRSSADPSRYYTGLTPDVPARIASHNAGRRHHTANAIPWASVVVIEFSDESRAVAFERYLKSGSGAALAKRRLR